MDQSLASIQAEFEQFLLDLTTVERKVIHALTDVARDVLASRPHGAPGVAGAITNRVVQVGWPGGRRPALTQQQELPRRSWVSPWRCGSRSPGPPPSACRRRPSASSCPPSTCWTASSSLWASRTPPTLQPGCLRWAGRWGWDAGAAGSERWWPARMPPITWCPV